VVITDILLDVDVTQLNIKQLYIHLRTKRNAHPSKAINVLEGQTHRYLSSYHRKSLIDHR